MKFDELKGGKDEKKEELNKMIADFMDLPAIKKGIDMYQNKFHEFHVERHTEEFVKHIQKILRDEKDEKKVRNMVIAGVLHDIGKPAVATPKEKDGQLKTRTIMKGELAEDDMGVEYPYHDFDGHDVVGAEMVRAMEGDTFKNYSLDQENIATLVGAHYMPMKGIKGLRGTTDFAKFKESFDGLASDLEKELEDSFYNTADLMGFFLADKLAQGKYCTDKDELLAIRDALLVHVKLKDESTGDLNGELKEKLEAAYELQKKESEKNSRYGKKE